MYSEIFNKWQINATRDTDLIEELNSVQNNSEEISDRFYTELPFGTAGLRGVIGAGTNRMNVYTVGRASQAMADYVNSVTDNGKIAIAYDSRIKSELFAKTAAEIIANCGVKVYLYNELMPTPMLSFAVRELKCDAGIVITASHNPSIYNGFKAYGSDGCQLPPDAADAILKRMESIDYFGGINFGDFDNLLKDGKIEYISDEIIEKYLCEVQKQSFADDSYNLKDFSVIYTPLHGTGNKPVRAILDKIGIKNVTVVPEQELPNGNFPTCPYPNPEIRQPFEIALEMSKNIKADLILATDPDADRVGIAVLENGDATLISGNDVGVLLLNYILERRTKLGLMPKNPIAIKTIVTTEVCRKITDKYGCELIDVLTGFKFIGEQIALLEEKGEENRYILGFEESYGYLPGSYVRDKDAVVASMLICEMAAYYKSLGMSLTEKLNSIFEEFGFYLNAQKSFAFEGQSGMMAMRELMDGLRANPPKEFAGETVAEIFDYQTSVSTNILNGTTAEIKLPKSNVIVYFLTDGTKVVFRPSGTEPKVKLYLGCVAKTKTEAQAKIDKILEAAQKIFK